MKQTAQLRELLQLKLLELKPTSFVAETKCKDHTCCIKHCTTIEGKKETNRQAF